MKPADKRTLNEHLQRARHSARSRIVTSIYRLAVVTDSRSAGHELEFGVRDCERTEIAFLCVARMASVFESHQAASASYPLHCYPMCALVFGNWQREMDLEACESFAIPLARCVSAARTTSFAAASVSPESQHRKALRKKRAKVGMLVARKIVPSRKNGATD